MSTNEILEKIAEVAFEDEMEKNAKGLTKAILRGGLKGAMMGSGVGAKVRARTRIKQMGINLMGDKPRFTVNKNLVSDSTAIGGFLGTTARGAAQGAIIGAPIGALIGGSKHAITSSILKNKLKKMNAIQRAIYKLTNKQELSRYGL